MAKASKKSPKEASNLFHSIMKASVSKPVKKQTRPKEKAVKKKK
jgi:hypothetical protein